MQGIFLIDGGRRRRPKSKKEVRERIASGEADTVLVEATSLFGNEFDGPITSAPEGRIDFVGPDPYERRNFYGNLFVTEGADGTRSYKVK